MAEVFNTPIPQFLTDTGEIAVGYQMFFYETGTTTKKAIYSDEDLTVEISNPQLVNSEGYLNDGAEIFLSSPSSEYKIVYAPSTDSDPPTSPIWTADPYSSIDNDINNFGDRPAQYWGTTTTSSTNNYQISPYTAIAEYDQNLWFAATINETNTDTVTLAVEDLNSLGNYLEAQDVGKYNLSGAVVDLVAGDLVVNKTYEFIWIGTQFVVLNPDIPYMQADNIEQATTSTLGVSYLISNITISNDVSDANNDIDFSAGTFQFSDGSGQAVLSALVKRLDALWAAGTNQGGLDTGTETVSTWYYCYAIYNPTSGVSDALFTATFGSPTMPSGYTKSRYVGAFYNDSSGVITPFLQSGNIFYYLNKGTFSAAGDYVATGSYGTSQVLVTLRIPPITGIIARFIFRPSQVTNSADRAFLVRSSLETNAAPVQGSAVPASSDKFDINMLSGTSEMETYFEIPTNNAQVWYRGEEATDANSGIVISTKGWTDTNLQNL